ncbi:MAG: DUF2185 domain-containing protein [Planctomycetes bacterium]|nr:DUF2185 domain-containing protein [Planctomycetota bacterium]
MAPWYLRKGHGARPRAGLREHAVALRPGDQVRLRFVEAEETNPSLAEESLWVRVAHVVPGPSYVGLVQQPPRRLGGIDRETPVLFTAEHIEEIASVAPATLDFDPLGLVVCTRALLAPGAVSVLARRDPPTQRVDSGWRLVADGDDESDLDTPQGHAVMQLGPLVERDPTLRVILGAGVGARFERIYPGEPWTRVDQPAVHPAPD